MALEDIIAQRIAAMSAARMRLNESISTFGPINQGLEALRQAKARKEAVGLQTRGLDLQERSLAQREAEFEAEQEPLPEFLRGPIAEALVPKPAPISGGDLPAPFSAPAAFGNPAQTAIRREKIDAITSALGARGGANLMAKLAAYSALNKAQQAEAAERLKMTSMMAAAAGGPKALRPDMDPEGAAAGLTQYRATEGAEAVQSRFDEKEARLRETAEKAGAEKKVDRMVSAARLRGEAPVFDSEGTITGFAKTAEETRKEEAAKRSAEYLTIAIGEKDRRLQRQGFEQAMTGLRAAWAAYRDPLTGMVDMKKWAANEGPAMRGVWDGVKAAAVRAGTDLREVLPDVNPSDLPPPPPPIPGAKPVPKTIEQESSEDIRKRLGLAPR